MAKYQIAGAGWPVDQWLIPNGVVIDDVSGTDGWSALIRQRGLPPPVNASPLDAAIYNQMVALYGAHRVGLVPREGGGDVV